MAIKLFSIRLPHGNNVELERFLSAALLKAYGVSEADVRIFCGIPKEDRVMFQKLYLYFRRLRVENVDKLIANMWCCKSLQRAQRAAAVAAMHVYAAAEQMAARLDATPVREECNFVLSAGELNFLVHIYVHDPELSLDGSVTWRWTKLQLCALKPSERLHKYMAGTSGDQPPVLYQWPDGVPVNWDQLGRTDTQRETTDLMNGYVEMYYDVPAQFIIDYCNVLWQRFMAAAAEQQQQLVPRSARLELGRDIFKIHFDPA